MSLIQFCGWGTGDSQEAVNVSGTWSVQSVVVDTGDYALRINPTGAAVGYHEFRGLQASGNFANLAGPTAWIRIRFRYATRPSSGDEPIMAVEAVGGPLKFELRLNSSGQLVAYDSVLSAMGTGATALSADTFYTLEVKCGTETGGGANASWEVRINGTSELSGEAGVLGTANVRSVSVGKRINRNDNTVDYYYANLCVDNADYPIATGRVVRKDATGNGFYTAWTGTYADVDEVPHDTDTTYISNATSGDAETVALESFASAGGVGTPLSVKTCAIVRDETVVSAVQVRLRSGLTDDDTTSNDPGATYVLRAKVYNTDPATSLAWTTVGLDAAEVGVENNANAALRCTALSLMVWEDGVAVASPAAGLSGLSGLSGLRGIC